MESKLTQPDEGPELGQEKVSMEREKDSLRVKVALRIRPLIKRDMTEQIQIAIQSETGGTSVTSVL